jgi:N-acetylmuramate 1-kinase
MIEHNTTASPQSRQQALQTWARAALTKVYGVDPGLIEVSALGGDASFRRYFRYQPPPESGLPASLMLVDAPPASENNPAFLFAARAFRTAGLHTPVIYAWDLEQGFMVLEDFGDQLYLPILQQARRDADMARVDVLYGQAMGALLALQACPQEIVLPPYSQSLLHQELSLFEQWFCADMLGLMLNEAEKALLARTWDTLERAALAQPQVPVHRDFHSRNLMVRVSVDGSHIEDQPPGVIDFQDAVSGPVTYDLVSLLRDCYIVWPPAEVERWLQDFARQARASGILPERYSDEKLLRDFDLMGLQRHIKVLGIFCRLALRDGKTAYLNDLPVVIDYVLQVAAMRPEMADFLQWFRAGPEPMMRRKLAERST